MSTTFQIWIVQLLLSTNSVKKFKEVSLGATKKSGSFVWYVPQSLRPLPPIGSCGTTTTLERNDQVENFSFYPAKIIECTAYL